MSGQVEQEATALGWAPKESFRGDPEKWVDAETYLERGRTVMPILKATNAKLEGRVRQQESAIADLTAQVKASQESMRALQETQVEVTKLAVKRKMVELKEKLRAARESDDVDAEMELLDEMQEVREQEKAQPEPKKEAPPPTAQALSPAVKDWMAKNPWFGVDERKTKTAMGLAQVLRADPENEGLSEAEFYEKVSEAMAERLGGPPRSKVAEGHGPSGGGGKGVRTYADLPPDAKEVCDRQGKRLVGEGKRFATEAEWRKYYVNLVYAGDE